MDDMTEMAASVAARCRVDRKGSSKPEKTCHWVVGTSLNVRHCRVQGSYARQAYAALRDRAVVRRSDPRNRTRRLLDPTHGWRGPEALGGLDSGIDVHRDSCRKRIEPSR